MSNKGEKNLFAKMNRWIFGSVVLDEEYNDDEVDESCKDQYRYKKREPYMAIYQPKQNNDLSDNSVNKNVRGRGTAFKIGIYKLTQIKEVQSLLNMTVSNPVVVELLGEEKQRMLDMISGAAYVGKLSVCRVAPSIFLVAPEYCSVEDTIEQEECL